MIIGILSSDAVQRARSPEAEYTLRPDVLFLRVRDGSGRLLDLGGEFCGISASGAEMLQELLHVGVQATAQRIAKRYGVKTQEVQKDLIRFVRDLEKRQFLCRQSIRDHLSGFQDARSSSVLFSLLALARPSAMIGQNHCWTILTVARIALRLFGWSRTVAAWKQHYGYQAKGRSANVHEATAAAIDKEVRAVASRHMLGMGCKERALCCWALLRSSGVPAALVVGVQLFPLSSHCWCRYRSLVLSDDQDRCDRFTPVLTYD